MTTKIQLFDGNFPNAPSSVMGKTPKNIEYMRLEAEYFEGISLFTDEHINSPHVDEVRSKYKIGWLHEPFCLHPQTYRKAFFNLEKFDLIMTYYAPFLELENTAFCPYGGIWIPRDQWEIHEKKYSVSMLYGDKMSTQGHQIRHDIAAKIQNDPILGQSAHLYHNPGYGWEAKVKTLAPYYFSVVTETCLEDNLFTEWLLDCFIMKTVPIYWGCPNIDKFFNPLGVLSFTKDYEAMSFLRMVCNGEAEEIYFSQVKAIQDNFRLAQQYEITEDWFYLNVLKDRYAEAG